ncbi:MAG: hypothetical protein HC783_08660 [Rhodobacteraceae bacterium]|nr:hypothetical protein [Paracoccaceae bacterium]
MSARGVAASADAIGVIEKPGRDADDADASVYTFLRKPKTGTSRVLCVLNFTPVVVDQDIINLTINAAVSQIDTTNGFTQADGTVIPAFRQRLTTTTVEMRDGQSFAIAGLLQDDFRNNASQVPWIGDLPVLGALFRSADYQRSQTELVIIVTPHLVTPVSGEALALPTDRVRLPTERDLFLRGEVAKSPNGGGAAGEVARQDFSTSYGYVME